MRDLGLFCLIGRFYLRIVGSDTRSLSLCLAYLVILSWLLSPQFGLGSARTGTGLRPGGCRPLNCIFTRNLMPTVYRVVLNEAWN